MKVLVTGVLGQDGANMVEYLLKNTDHEIYGVIRRSSNPNFVNCQEFMDNARFKFVYGDLSDNVSIDSLVKDIQPDYFINFGAQSFVGCSWEIPLQTFDVNATGVVRCLEAIRKNNPNCRFYSAGSSEEFGDVSYSPQDIRHPIRPRSPYGASKAAARHAVKVYRESYNLYAVHGILSNHEGVKRGQEFVTRKISKGVARINHSIDNKQPFTPIELGNLNAKRDWSDSEDFVDGVWRMINQEKYRPDLRSNLYKGGKYSKTLLANIKDYILSSNETHSIREFVEKAFQAAGLEGAWHGNAEGEEFSLTSNLISNRDARSSVLVKINPKFYRPAEVELLLGDSSEAREELGWSPKSSFSDLVNKMVKHDISLLTNPR
jgi:GDPmannose 4,6-dehydratase